MLFYVFGIFSMFYFLLSFFHKKLIPLLCLECIMVLIIFLYFFSFLGSSMNNVFFFNMIFLVFMVLDSVLGISLLISCSRGSTYLNYFLN